MNSLGPLVAKNRLSAFVERQIGFHSMRQSVADRDRSESIFRSNLVASVVGKRILTAAPSRLPPLLIHRNWKKIQVKIVVGGGWWWAYCQHGFRKKNRVSGRSCNSMTDGEVMAIKAAAYFLTRKYKWTGFTKNRSIDLTANWIFFSINKNSPIY